MDYPFEQLTPERFQQLCQALLVKEYPGVQSFPVAQPDGGRDAIMYVDTFGARSFVIYQVKFVRQNNVDPNDWLAQVIGSEIEKVANLVPRGASKFVLITNLTGTAHLDAGRIDRLHEALAAAMPIPTEGWWRDDLSRRLDNAWDLKWTYPELMTGPDLIRSIIEAGLREDQERRGNAIRAYVRDQFDRDSEVKFKQVELQNKLLDLFIDVPVAPPTNASSRQQHWQLATLFRGVARASTSGPTPHISGFNSDYVEFPADAKSSIGAATFFLSPVVQQHLPLAVLEGAPGQGKSTVSQYLCQIHRMRILRRVGEISQVPEEHRSGPTRLPFKIDLRDLAMWLSGINPFSGDSSISVLGNWHKSLEAFLAAHVEHYSGGVSFKTSDLLAIARISSLLLVFDGLDEVADINVRKDVVDEIAKGVGRLDENSVSLQVLVTSRPAAFANSPGLPETKFPYLQLDSVTRPLVEAYTEKWLKSRRLFGREAAEVRKILKQRLEEPHIKDLARNPMQLAILLSLVHTRGSSLPDKRTALYDSYTELFFNREAEKSDIVRTHRDLLLNIHRYLGWTLHAEAESGVGNGIASEERLHDLLRRYLRAEGHDPELAGLLFKGMVERVVALVSRVQGTYEFEVQPLREYFAGRYLYETAPYSPPGNEKPGTKPERFDALARNFYWTNVTRFYAGCYSKGELASLIDRLQELINDPVFGYTSHARTLAATLLSDWVFTQHPKSVREVIRLVLDGIGLRFLITSARRKAGGADPLVLPEQSGRRELVARCVEALGASPPREYALDLIDILKANASETETLELFTTIRPSQPSREQWLELGHHLGALSRLPLSELALLDASTLSDREIEILIRAGRFDYLQSSAFLFSATQSMVVRSELFRGQGSRIQSPFEVLIFTLSTFSYIYIWSFARRFPLRIFWERQLGIDINALREMVSQNEPQTKAIANVFSVLVTEADRPVEEWVTSLRPWESIIESLQAEFGSVWGLYRLANYSAGIRSREEKGGGSADLFDEKVALSRRARYARFRASSVAWWRDTLRSAQTPQERMFCVLLLLTWGSTVTVEGCREQLESSVDCLSPNDWHLLYESCRAASIFNQDAVRRNVGAAFREAPWGEVSPRVAALLALRSSKAAYTDLLLQHVGYVDEDPVVNQFLLNAAAEFVEINDGHWDSILPLVSRAYIGGARSLQYATPQVRRPGSELTMPLCVAEEVAGHAEKYPGFIVAIAEAVATQRAASVVRSLNEVALTDHWFLDDIL